MTPHDDYTWMVGAAAAWWQAEQAKPKKPSLTLVTTTPLEERNQAMSTSEIKQPDGICRMWNGEPLTKHGAFQDLDEAQRMLSMGSNALKGIGALMLPSVEADDKETSAKRLELSEIFSFFGEVMADNARIMSEAVWRIEQAAKGQAS